MFYKENKFLSKMLTLYELQFCVFYLYDSGRLIGMEQKMESMCRCQFN